MSARPATPQERLYIARLAGIEAALATVASEVQDLAGDVEGTPVAPLLRVVLAALKQSSRLVSSARRWSETLPWWCLAPATTPGALAEGNGAVMATMSQLDDLLEEARRDPVTHREALALIEAARARRRS